MIGSAITQLAGARRIALLSAGFDESIVQLWDVAHRKQIGEFKAQFTFGGANLALDPNGRCIVTGVSSRSGTIAAYDALSGRELWTRSRVRYPTYLRFSPSGHQISCTIDDRAVELLNAETGSTSLILEGVRAYFEGGSGQTFRVLNSRSHYLLRPDASRPTEFQIKQSTFAVLDACFGPDDL